MKKEDLWDVYDEKYAETYNERFLTNPFSKLSLDFELSVLKGLLDKDSSWLDLGCGTGYFLSQFPGIKRAGLDISPGMLSAARINNPDAEFLVEGDFLDAHPEWENMWSLVSSMWYAYGYVESIRETEQLINNMISWTKDGGSLFLPIIGLEDLRPNHNYPYKDVNAVYKGNLYVTSFTWTWEEADTNLVHENMVAPHADHFIELLKTHFETVEIVRYPPYMSGWISRKAILAKGKRGSKPGQEAKVIWHDIPAPMHKIPGYYSSPAPFLSNANLFKELGLRIIKGRLILDLVRKVMS